MSETLAKDWRQARKAGKRLPEHELRCEACGEPSNEPVCTYRIETQLQSEIHQ